MQKKDEEKVVELQKEQGKRRPRGDQHSPLGADMNEALRSWDILDTARASGQ